MSQKFHALTIKEVRKETADCVSIHFDIPNDLLPLFHFLPGQYLTVRTQLEGREVRRSYSLCSAPGDGEVRVAVKRMENGLFSEFAQNLQSGDSLEVMPPMGNFTPKFNEEKKPKHYVAFVAGSGITPIMGIMRDVLFNYPKSNFTLVYGNKGRSSIIFKEAIEALKNRFIGRLAVYHLFSREALEVELFNGRITGEKVKELSEKLIPISTIDEAFICGPEEMIVGVREHLLTAGMEKGNVHAELFSSPDEPNKHHDAWVQKAATSPDLLSTVRITLDSVTSQFNLAYKGDSILDAALKNGADLPYACKGGVCSTCRAKLVSGAVEMEVNYALTDEEVEKGYILTCQSHPKTDQVHVDFDIF